MAIGAAWAPEMRAVMPAENVSKEASIFVVVVRKSFVKLKVEVVREIREGDPLSAVSERGKDGWGCSISLAGLYSPRVSHCRLRWSGEWPHPAD